MAEAELESELKALYEENKMLKEKHDEDRNVLTQEIRSRKALEEMLKDVKTKARKLIVEVDNQFTNVCHLAELLCKKDENKIAEIVLKIEEVAATKGKSIGKEAAVALRKTLGVVKSWLRSENTSKKASLGSSKLDKNYESDRVIKSVREEERGTIQEQLKTSADSLISFKDKDMKLYLCVIEELRDNANFVSVSKEVINVDRDTEFSNNNLSAISYERDRFSFLGEGSDGFFHENSDRKSPFTSKLPEDHVNQIEDLLKSIQTLPDKELITTKISALPIYQTLFIREISDFQTATKDLFNTDFKNIPVKTTTKEHNQDPSRPNPCTDPKPSPLLDQSELKDLMAQVRDALVSIPRIRDHSLTPPKKIIEQRIGFSSPRENGRRESLPSPVRTGSGRTEKNDRLVVPGKQFAVCSRMNSSGIINDQESRQGVDGQPTVSKLVDSNILLHSFGPAAKPSTPQIPPPQSHNPLPGMYISLLNNYLRVIPHILLPLSKLLVNLNLKSLAKDTITSMINTNLRGVKEYFSYRKCYERTGTLATDIFKRIAENEKKLIEELPELFVKIDEWMKEVERVELHGHSPLKKQSSRKTLVQSRSRNIFSPVD